MKEDRYRKFSTYLKECFGSRVHKISVDAGFSCPNRDGRISKTGCIYCDNRAFSTHTRSGNNGLKSLELQIREGIRSAKTKYGAEKFIVYFQAYTNTYAPLEVLKERYDTIKKFKDIVGMAVGTRPDCVDKEILDLISGYSDNYEVWIEYGVQSIHKKTLDFIKRGHCHEDFLKAVALTRRNKNIKICAHVVIGLPGETTGDIIATAKELARLKINGIKIHPLHIIKGTALEGLFKKKIYRPLGVDEYVMKVTQFLEYLSPEMIIQRITADCPKEFLISPEWILDKVKVLDKIEQELSANNRRQGRLYMGGDKICMAGIGSRF